jgi:photosystem II stability/assembly factor-like uncharacterized protein
MSLINDRYGSINENNTHGNISLINSNFWKRYSTKDVYEWNQYNIKHGIDDWSVNIYSFGSLFGIAYGYISRFVIVSYSGNTYYADDSDTLVWSKNTNTSVAEELLKIRYLNNKFIALGVSNSTIVVSSSGTAWDKTSNQIQISDIAYGNNRFVAVGYNGNICASSDADSWTSRSSGTSNNLSGITYGNNLFVIVGANGTILTSPDGITWTSRTSSTSNNLSNITYANNLFVIVGYYGTIITSPDGITWTNRNSGTAIWLSGIAYGNNLFVAVGNSGTILTSSDGITWTIRTSGTSNSLYDITYGNNKFVAVGDKGSILTSNPNTVSKDSSTGNLVTSNSSSTYPTDGISGNYWYTYSRTYKSSDVYLNTVGSINSNTYPDNGVGSDGYYYIKQ